MFRNLFWDMGGTMFDTYPQVDATLAGVIRNHGHRIENHEVSRLTRIATHVAINELSRRFDIAPTEFTAAQTELKQRWRSDPPPAMAGLSEVMSAASGKNLVVTHRDRKSAMALLKSHDIKVDDLICPGDGYRRKPDPQMYLELITRHGLSPADCLGIGDRPLDAQAAQAAGIHAAALITPKLDLPVEPAQFTVHALTELLALVE